MYRALLLFSLLASPIAAQDTLRVSFHRISPADDVTHLDIVAGQSTWITANRTDITWTTDDKSIAYVANGRVYASKPGVTFIHAMHPKGKVDVRVCSTPTEYRRIDFEKVNAGLIWKADSTKKDRWAEFKARDPLFPEVDWTGCVHWFAAPPDGRAIMDTSTFSINQHGTMLFNHRMKKYYVGAAIGTKFPGVVLELNSFNKITN